MEFIDQDYCAQVFSSICPLHVTDAVLRDKIATHATEASCDYCTADGSRQNPIAITFDDFLAAFMVGVYLFYQPQDMPSEHAELLTSVYDSGDVAREILDIAGVTHAKLAEDVVDALAMTQDWVERDWQRLAPDLRLTYNWDAFKELVKHETRFFFADRVAPSGDPDEMSPAQLLKAVSAVIEDADGVWPAPCPYPIYRARMVGSPSRASECVGAQQLGPPPLEKAAANRMSPAGISIFYGATDRPTSIAEAGSHSSERYVVTGEFTPAREIRLIDLTTLPDVPSIFDGAEHDRYFGLRFLRKFVDDITLPVELDGREHIDYVPTQVFTEYLRFAFPARVDGLMFPSC